MKPILAPAALPIMPNRRVGTWCGLIFVALAGTILFLDKAPQVDDVYYLSVAQRILQKPLDPYGGELPNVGGTGFLIPNPPLWSYVLAAGMALGGENRSFLHALEGAMFLALVVGLYRLAERCSAWPLFWTMVIAWSPFLLPGQNLMLDHPMLALQVWGIVWLLRAGDVGSSRQAALAGLLFGLATLTKYTAGLSVMLIAGSAIHRRRPTLWIALGSMSVPLGLWCVQNLWAHGTLHVLSLLQPGGHLTAAADRLPFVERGEIFFRSVGSVFLLTPILLLAVVAERRRLSLLVLILLAGAGWTAWHDLTVTIQEAGRSNMVVNSLRRGHVFAFSFNGGLLLGLAVLAGWIGWRATPDQLQVARRTTGAVLTLWFVSTVAFNLLLLPKVPFGAIRHLHGVLVPLLLGTAADLERVWRQHWLGRSIGWLCVACQLALGWGLAHADWTIANLHPRFAERIIRPVATRQKVWFTGDAMYRWTMQRAGADYLAKSDLPNLDQRPAGEILILSYLQNVELLFASQVMRRPFTLQTYRIDDWNPLRVVAQFVNFYGGNRLSLPWELALMPIDSSGWLPAWVKLPVEEMRLFELR